MKRFKRFVSVAWVGMLVVAGGSGEPAREAGKEADAPGVEPRHGRVASSWQDRTGVTTGSPTAAEDGVLVYDPIGRQAILIGGKADDDTNTDEVWALDLVRHSWERLDTPEPRPGPREDHVAIYDPVGHRVIVHGGEEGLTKSDTWALDLRTRSWRELEGVSPGREDHTAVYVDRHKRMVIFGGRNRQEHRDRINIRELWALDLDPTSASFERWTEIAVKGELPPGRSDQLAVYDRARHRMVIYGGWDKRKKEYLDDTWAFQFGAFPDSSGRWREIKTKSSHPPSRRHVAGAYDPERNWLIICGGYGDEGYLNDVWALDLATDAWINITPGPQPRLDHHAIWDPESGRLILYGGDARLSSKFHDLWELGIDPELPFGDLIQEVGRR